MTFHVSPAQYRTSLETLAGFWTMGYTQSGLAPLDLFNLPAGA